MTDEELEIYKNWKYNPSGDGTPEEFIRFLELMICDDPFDDTEIHNKMMKKRLEEMKKGLYFATTIEIPESLIKQIVKNTYDN